MRFLSIITIFTIPMNIQAMSKCHEKCIELDKLRELVVKCNYVIHNFPEENQCFPPNYYKDLYANQTTFGELREQCKYYKIQLSFIVVEMYFYILILVLFIMSMRNPLF